MIFKVEMSCNACKQSVERVLSRMPGINSYQVNLETQLVKVDTNLSVEDVHRALLKTGKQTTIC